jgi:hypothetical protein
MSIYIATKTKKCMVWQKPRRRRRNLQNLVIGAQLEGKKEFIRAASFRDKIREELAKT